MNKIIILALTIAAFMASCGKESNSYTDKVDCSNINAAQNTYTNSVKAILDGSCAFSGCHNSQSAAEGVVLDNYASAKKEFVNGNSLCTIYHDCKPMPQGGGKLAQGIIDQLTCWVKNGAPE